MVSPVASPRSMQTLMPMLGVDRERILICGDSWAGKSFAWLQIAQRMFEEDKERSIAQRRKVFVVDTGNAAVKFLGDGREFDHLYFRNDGNVYPFTANTYKEYGGSVRYILENARGTDWVALDTIGQLNEYAQHEVAKIKSAQLADIRVSKDSFGGFEPSEWNMVKRFHDSIINALDTECKSHLLFLAHIAPYIEFHAKKKPIVLAMFDEVGMKPDARESVYKLADTVLFVWTRTVTVQSGKNYKKRSIFVLKDRGEPYDIEDIYDMNVIEKLIEIRGKSIRPTNATPEIIAAIKEQERLDAEALEAEAIEPTEL